MREQLRRWFTERAVAACQRIEGMSRDELADYAVALSTGALFLAAVTGQTALAAGDGGEAADVPRVLTEGVVPFIMATRFVVFAVDVHEDGGDDGTATGPATWTYTLLAPDGSGRVLGRKVPPRRPRRNGPTAPGAGPGLAYVGPDGEVVLVDAGEVWLGPPRAGETGVPATVATTMASPPEPEQV